MHIRNKNGEVIAIAEWWARNRWTISRLPVRRGGAVNLGREFATGEVALIKKAAKNCEGRPTYDTWKKIVKVIK